MARTIVDQKIREASSYVWLEQAHMKEITVECGHYEWTVDLEKGECSLNSFPLNIDTARANEIITALREIMPMLKPAHK